MDTLWSESTNGLLFGQTARPKQLYPVKEAARIFDLREAATLGKTSPCATATGMSVLKNGRILAASCSGVPGHLPAVCMSTIVRSKSSARKFICPEKRAM